MPYELLDEPASGGRYEVLPPAGSGSDLIDGANVVGTGYFKGMTALAGLPVDTIANIMDLGNAAIGAPYTAITGKPAPDMLQIGDRSR